jgi:hypothetical protein
VKGVSVGKQNETFAGINLLTKLSQVILSVVYVLGSLLRKTGREPSSRTSNPYKRGGLHSSIISYVLEYV